jgi:uncharacterized protein (DUF305 family)
MGISRVLQAIPVMVLACAFPVFSQGAGRPVMSPASDSKPVIVQPGAPGQPSRILPDDTRATAPPISPMDIEFIRDMILHHSQAVELTELIEDRTEDSEIRLLGARIMQSQTDEMEFMRKWLAVNRGRMGSLESLESLESRNPERERVSAPRTSGAGHGKSHEGMPGMLSPQQMIALKRASGKEFDRLFLLGMIQHHQGAIEMVGKLFSFPGTGQNAELFRFASDVYNDQRVEINTMQTMLRNRFPNIQ